MKSINRVELLGNISNDLELKYTDNGNAVLTFNIATNYSYKKNDSWQEGVNFHRVVFWRKAAELIKQYCSKGSKIWIEGKLQTRSWEDKDGKKNYTTEVVGKDFIFLDGKKKEEKSEEPFEDEGEIDTEELAENVPF